MKTNNSEYVYSYGQMASGDQINNNKFILAKIDYELFKEDEASKQSTVFRIKMTGTINKNEKWKIFCNEENIFTIDGCKISKKEKEYLRTKNGIIFILSKAKEGIKSLQEFRKELKILIKKG